MDDLKNKMLYYKNTPLMIKSLRLTTEVITFCRWLEKFHHEYEISKQLLRSASSVGANINEARYAESKRDFLHKFKIALKECSETEYWLVVLQETGLAMENFQTILEINTECLRLLIASCKTISRSLECNAQQ